MLYNKYGQIVVSSQSLSTRGNVQVRTRKPNQSRWVIAIPSSNYYQIKVDKHSSAPVKITTRACTQGKLIEPRRNPKSLKTFIGDSTRVWSLATSDIWQSASMNKKSTSSHHHHPFTHAPHLCAARLAHQKNSQSDPTTTIHISYTLYSFYLETNFKLCWHLLLLLAKI